MFLFETVLYVSLCFVICFLWGIIFLCLICVRCVVFTGRTCVHAYIYIYTYGCVFLFETVLCLCLCVCCYLFFMRDNIFVSPSVGSECLLVNVFLFYLQTGPFVKLQMGCELSLYVDSECPTYCFNPCGHVASDGTVKYVHERMESYKRDYDLDRVCM